MSAMDGCLIFTLSSQGDGQTVPLDKHPMPSGNWFKVPSHRLIVHSFQMISKVPMSMIKSQQTLKKYITKQTVFENFRLL